MAQKVVALVPGEQVPVVWAWPDDIDAWSPPGPAWLVDERVQWDDDPGGARLVRVSFIHRLPSLTREQFARHWGDVHAPIARRHHPAILRYVQNVVIRPLTPDAAGWDGIAELYFRSLEDLETRMYDSPEGREVVAEDVARFIDVPAGERYVFELDPAD